MTDAARQWEGWGTALKPAHEPIVVARKPLIGTVAANVQAFGTGALNIDASRVPGAKPDTTRGASMAGRSMGNMGAQGRIVDDGLCRWPANVIHDGSEEVVDAFPDNGSAARFFYCAKASRADRNDGCDGIEAKFAPTMGNGIGEKEHDPETATMKQNHHPTVKPTDLMRYLVTLVTPPGGVVLDPFMGSGSTGRGCALAGFDFIGCELDAGYVEIARARINAAELEAERIACEAADAIRQSALFA